MNSKVKAALRTMGFALAAVAIANRVPQIRRIVYGA